jgi:hypothetical protein
MRGSTYAMVLPAASESCFLIGRPKADEAVLEETIGGSVPRFFALAQRCVWGVTQSDLVRVDDDLELRRLVRLYPKCFVGHLLVAFTFRSRAPSRADAALRQAFDLATPNHPWRYLLPSPAEWSCALQPQRLRSVIPDRLWRVRSEEVAGGTAFPIVSQGSLIRLESGGLAFINPVDLSDAVRDQVQALGAVELLATQGKAHSRHIERTRALFRRARVLGSPGHLSHPVSSHIRFDGVLGTESARLPSEWVELPIAGTEASEVALLHVPTKLLFFQDLVSNNRADNPARPFVGRLEYFAFGLVDRIGWMSYHPALWNDLRRLQSSLKQVLRCDYEHVIGAHWPDEPCAGAARDAFDASLRWVIELSPFRHKCLSVRYFSRQPGFLRDMLLYRRAQRKPAAHRGTGVLRA